jgi:ABC-type dipeptide/oligopeptide/nickel transport system permease component
LVNYLIRRAGTLLLVLFGVLTITFFVIHLTPGDPARILAGFDAPYETVEAIRHQLGLDRPLHIQYLNYLVKVLQGNLGFSFSTNRPVVEEIGWRYKNTLKLAITAVVLATALGLLFGGLAVRRPYSSFDSLSMVMALLGVSAPIFWLGIILMWVFGVQLRWFPTGGVGSIRHLILPAITLGAALGGIIARMTRSSLLEALEQDYIRTARAAGFAERTITYKYALKNALLPIVTVVGLQLGYSLAGAVLTETVFAWPGLGRLLVDAIFARDYAVIQGGFLVVAATFAMVNFLVDILYGMLDPRIRYD